MKAKSVTELLLRDGTGGVNLVTENKEGNLVELLDGEEGVELGFRLVEALRVLRVYEEDDAVDFGEVVLPEAASCRNGREKEGKGEGKTEGKRRAECISEGRESGGEKANAPCW